MDAESFAALCAEDALEAEGGIGTLGEKRLHAVIKRWYEPRPAYREVKLGRIVADICNESGVTEIQTGSYSALAKKLPRLLCAGPVRVVCPVPAQKRISWIDPATGELSPLRKSPKNGCPADAAYHLCRIAPFLSDPALTVDILLVDLEEYRLQNGWDTSGKRGSVRADRLPRALARRVVLARPADWLCLLPPGLPAPFTSGQLRTALHRSPNLCAKLLRTLTAAGVLCRAGKEKNSILYQICARSAGNPSGAEMEDSL